MAWLKNKLPLLVAFYILFTGIFFLANVLLDSTLVATESSKKVWIGSIAIALIGFGISYIYFIRTGRLKKTGPTVEEVRAEAVSNMKSISYLSGIAENDPSPEVRQTAANRLEELAES